MHLFLHDVKNVKLGNFAPDNQNLVSLDVVSTMTNFHNGQKADAEFRLTLFGLPTNVAMALADALNKLPAPLPDAPKLDVTAIVTDLDELARDEPGPIF